MQQHRFRIAKPYIRKSIDLIVEHVHTFNADRVGKRPRNTIKIDSFVGSVLDDGTMDLVLVTRGDRSAYMQVYVPGDERPVQRFKVFGSTSFHDLFRSLKHMCVRHVSESCRKDRH